MALTLIASLVLVSSALATSAGDEYLPKIPDSGGSAGAGSSGANASGSSPSSASTGTGTPQTDGSGQQARETHKSAKKGGKSNRQQGLTLASDPGGGGGGGDGSGSILLSPLVIAMIAAVVAAAVGMTLSRRGGDDAETEGEGPPGSRLEADGPRTPDGEIIAGPDQAT